MSIKKIFLNNMMKTYLFAEDRRLGKLILLNESNQVWASSLRIGGSVLVIDILNRSVRYYTPALEFWRAEEVLREFENKMSIEIIAYLRYKIDLPENIKVLEGGYQEVIKREVSECVDKNISCGIDQVPLDVKDIAQERLINIREDISYLRSIKSSEEIDLIAKASNISIQALKKVIDEGVIGYSEKIIAGKLSYYMRVLGADQEAFPLIVASNENSAYPHAKPSSKTIEYGDLVLFDVGARVSEYNSDMTRILKSRISPREKYYLDVLEEALNKALEKIEVGVRASDIDSLVRDTLSKKGLGKYFIHSLGHGVGVDVHERPTLSSTSKDVLEKNMVVTIEPGIYFRGGFGVRLEDLVVVEERGPRILTSLERVLEY